MHIRITDDNFDALDAALAIANGKCTQRTLTAGDLIDLATLANRHLTKHHCNIKARQGCKVEYQQGISCNSYKWSATATYVVLVRGSRHWYLTCATRADVPTGRNSRCSRLHLSPTAVDAIQAAAVRNTTLAW